MKSKSGNITVDPSIAKAKITVDPSIGKSRVTFDPGAKMVSMPKPFTRKASKVRTPRRMGKR